MAGAFKKSTEQACEPEEEITVQRRAYVPAPPACGPTTRPTTQLTKIDSRLLAIARGDLEPDEVDPFGGLIPIYDEEPAEEVEDDWLILEPDPESESGASGELVFGNVTPHLRLRAAEVEVLPVGDRTALFVTYIDGKRTVHQLVDASGFDELEALETIHELLRMGVIDLR